VGEREVEILEAVLEVVTDLGYDRLTFDAVAAAAKASKATLYRRWPSKVDLVLDALELLKGVEADQLPDTGTLRGDLLAQACAAGGLTERIPVGVFGAILPALHRDPDLMSAFVKRLVEPKRERSEAAFRAAQHRGEIGKDADLSLLASILPALCIHEVMLSGECVSPKRIQQLVDSVVLPACAATLPA
jgi:AcrR family transcriptional regulator